MFPVSGGAVWSPVNQGTVGVEACASIDDTKVVEVQRCTERVKPSGYNAVTKE